MKRLIDPVSAVVDSKMPFKCKSLTKRQEDGIEEQLGVVNHLILLTDLLRHKIKMIVPRQNLDIGLK